MNLGYYNFNSFSSERFEAMAKLENGDCSWIVPGKLIAFSGPLSVYVEPCLFVGF